MEKTVISKIDLEQLAGQLYQLLRSDAIAFTPLQVNCSFSEETLIIIIQVPQTPTLETTATFSCVREFLDLQDISSLFPARIVLTVDDDDQFSSTANGEIQQITRMTATFPLQKPTRNRGKIVRRQMTQTSLFNKNNLRIPDFSRKKNSDHFPTKIILGLGLGLGILIIGLYGLSDPCVTGNCPSLTKAEFLTKSSLIALNPDSSNSLLTTRQQFIQALQQLQSIPWWSPSISKVNRLKTEYQDILKEIDLITVAITTGNQATFLMQKSSLSITHWQTTQNLLQKAIDQLDQLSPKSKFKSFAIAKQQKYQQILQFTNQRLDQEQEANASFDQALKIARLAKIQENMAQSSEDFGVISSTWKKAIQSLQNINQGTTPYYKTTKLLELYGQEFKNIDSRKNQEQIAKIAYQQAIQEGKKAEKAESSQQWSVAISHWNNALTYLKQIFPNTFQATTIKPILTNYTLSLKQAQANFTIANQSQNVKDNLAKICSQQGKLCDYSINKKGIKVKLTSSYLQQLWDLSIQAKLRANVQEQAGILNHLSRLEQSFQIISNTAKIPLEVYNSKGNLMTIYNPIHLKQ